MDTCGVFLYSISATDIHGNKSKYPICDLKQLAICHSPLTLAINELMASNETTEADEYGEYEDWVEIYNYGTDPIYLGDLYLSDKADNPVKWKFPEISIQAGEYLRIWADENEEQGNLHTNFKLSAGGEYIGLYDSDLDGNALIDGINFGEQQIDISYGRLPNGTGPFRFLIPTPGSMNETTTSLAPDLSMVQYHLYPNPAHDVMWIEADQEIPVSQSVVVMNIYGKVLFTKSFLGKVKLDIGGLSAGIYVLGIQKDGAMSRILKIVKE
jgi:hypothetical protein